MSVSAIEIMPLIQRTEKSSRGEHVDVDGEALYNARNDNDTASEENGPFTTTIVCHIGTEDET